MKNKPFKCYVIYSTYIDFGWEFLTTPDEFKLKIQNNYKSPYLEELIDSFERDLYHAIYLATNKGWEGDFCQKPRLFFIPMLDNDTIQYGFMFKQSHGGRTYVVSRVPLPHLEEQ